MGLAKHPTRGSGWWYIDVRPDGYKGKRQRIPFRGTEEQAIAFELQVLAALGKLPSMAPRTIQDALPDFMEHYRLDHQPRGAERTLYSFKRILPHFGKLLFQHVTAGTVSAYKTARLKDGATPSTINKELSALSSMMKWAEENGFCQEIIRIKMFPKKLIRPPLPVVPSKEEMHRLLACSSPSQRGLFACMYLAGLRSEEARTLTKASIDGNQLVIVGKGRKERRVPIIADLWPYLNEAAKNKGAFLFPNPDSSLPFKSVRDGLSAAAKRAGISSRVTPHTLRHAFGSHCVLAGIHIRAIQKALGHSSLQTTEIYTTINDKQMEDEFGKFGGEK